MFLIIQHSIIECYLDNFKPLLLYLTLKENTSGIHEIDEL